MALTPEEITFLSRPDKIRTTNLSEEAKEYRKKYLKGVYKENRLQREHAKRKAQIEGIELIDYTFKDWKSEEEFREWFQKDKIERGKILDELLADDDWLEKLAKKYYGEDNWMVVYADKETQKNWRRHELPDKKKYKKDEED